MSVSQGTWHTGEQIRDHKLACSVVNFHGTVDAVFDETCLDQLQRFTLARSIATRDQMMIDEEWVDGPDATKRYEKVLAKGSLTGLLIGRYGTDDEALDERDWEMLQDWFEKGRPIGEHVER